MIKGKQKRLLFYTFIALATSLAIISSVVRCAFLILNNYEEQLMHNLYDVSCQSAEMLQSQMNSRYDLLKSVNIRFEAEGDNSKNILDIYKPVVESFHLRRLGYLDAEGNTYATDGSHGNLSYREFFKRSMAGEVYISDVLNDALSEDNENVTVMSMPIKNNKGEIVGVTGITYESKVLSNEMSAKSFDGYGDNFVVNDSGHVIVTSDDSILPIGASITGENINVIDRRGNLIEGAVVRAMAKNERLEGQLMYGDTRCFFNLSPVSILDGNENWYILSIVPLNFLMRNFYYVRYHLIRMVIIVLLIVIFSAFGLRYYYRKQRKMAFSLAYKSSLTGGPNISRFLDTMNRVKGIDGYIAYMNLEDFTHTSIATGVEKSNALIKKVWSILKANIKQGEHACHDNADSFVIYLCETSDEDLKKRLTDIRNIIHEEGHGMDIPWVFPKFGACRINEGDDVKTCISKAEYTVFDTWGIAECVSFYNNEDLERQSMNKTLEDYFEFALAEERFEVWFQPKYSVDGDEMTGAEALVRWRKKDGGLIPPGVFIPILEKNGNIARLDEYVFEHVCIKLKEWKDAGLKVPPVSINLSRATLYRDKIVETYMEDLEKYGLEPSDIQLEITETIVGGSENILELLKRFREKGIKILMDDFGAGYSSLSTLNMKCFDTLKIDKSLVDGISDEYGRIIIYQTIEMGYALGLYITVEGVESKEQLELLNKTKCNDIQGYFFSRPLPVEDFEKMLGEAA